MIEIIKKIKNTPPKFIVKELKRRSYDKVYFNVRGNIVKRKPITIDSLLFHKWNSEINLTFNAQNKVYYIEYLKKYCDIKQLILQADKICNHTFDLLGSGEVNLGKMIKWNQDFKSGFVWENKFYKNINTIDLNNDADVKVPWELSRFQHIPLLGQAYWITSDEKYVDEFKNQINDWIIKNPVEMSVNWTCTMDVAIRACNWIVGIEFFRKSSIENDFWDELNKSLFLHGNFIFKNLEIGEISNNHYLSNLVGLIWLGLYFKGFNYKKDITKKWLEFGLAELEVEIKKQVYEDGFSFEASTAYHCLVLELLLYTSVLCSNNNIRFSDEFEKRLESMCEVLLNITKPNGLVPLFGDMDSGRFIVWAGYGNYEKRDFRYLLDVAGQYFNRSDFINTTSNQLTTVWLFMKFKDGLKKPQQMESVSYPEGGFHILRNDRVFLIVRCGQNGTGGIGGHTHNDQLSFELNIDGEDFIVDPGSPSYTSDYKMRNKFRSTAQHNTVIVDGIEQNDIFEKKLFKLSNQTNAGLLEFSDQRFKGKHYGYKKKIGIIHHREIVIRNNTIEISDFIENDNRNLSGKKTFNLILDSSVEVIENQNMVFLKKKNVKLSIKIGTKYEVCDSRISYEYGKLKNTKKIKIFLEGNKNITKILF